MQQIDALLNAMAEILWSVGEKSKVIIPLPGDVIFIPHSHTYFQDTVTERVLVATVEIISYSNYRSNCSNKQNQNIHEKLSNSSY